MDGEGYGLSKSKAERFLLDHPYPKNWTIVCPVISFSDRRLDMILTSGTTVVTAAQSGTVIKLPIEAKNLTAGLDWAGNSGKLIANLLFKEECIASLIQFRPRRILNGAKWLKFTPSFWLLILNGFPPIFPENFWHWKYDRAFDRAVDNQSPCGYRTFVRRF